VVEDVIFGGNEDQYQCRGTAPWRDEVPPAKDASGSFLPKWEVAYDRFGNASRDAISQTSGSRTERRNLVNGRRDA
jgi:hypothetical protein